MTKKKIVTISISVVLVIAVVIGALMISGRSKPVPVFSWDVVGYTDYFMSGGESSGMVTTDKVQSLFISETQKVTEIMVQEGQSVKEGDVLLTYDTTLSDLALERKDLDIQQKEITLKNAKAELQKLNAMKPMVIPPPPVTEPNPNQVDHSMSPDDQTKLNTAYDGDGRTMLTPYYFWLGKDTQVDDGMIGYLMAQAGNPDALYVVFQISPEDQPGTIFRQEYGLKFTKVSAPVPPETEPSLPIDPLPTEGTEPTDGTTPPETTAPTETAPTAPAAPAAARMSGGYSMSFFVPGQTEEEIAPPPDIDWGSGHTQAELEIMRKEKADQIKQLEIDIKVGKAELNIMKKEASDGAVRAQFDGVVTSVLEPDNAKDSKAPVVKVSGGGGFYVEGAVGELDLDSLKPGQKVQVNSWETGQSYEGEVVEIGQYPSDEQHSYSPGGVKQTYYPYRVFIDGSADLMEGSYVGLTYKAQTSEEGVMCLQNAFIRTEGNQSYVYLRNDKDVLEKRRIQVGVSRDGYSTPILGGVTMEDFLAFPYGKDIREGAPTFEGTEQDLISN